MFCRIFLLRFFFQFIPYSLFDLFIHEFNAAMSVCHFFLFSFPFLFISFSSCFIQIIPVDLGFDFVVPLHICLLSIFPSCSAVLNVASHGIKIAFIFGQKWISYRSYFHRIYERKKKRCFQEYAAVSNVHVLSNNTQN